MLTRPCDPTPSEREPSLWRRVVLERLGGPIGRYAAPGGAWRDGGAWLLLIGAATWLLVILRQQPCRQATVGTSVDTFALMCYSDIPVLYQARGQAQGAMVYRDIGWEYPVLSGYLVEISRFLSDLVIWLTGGVPSWQAPTGQPALDNANVYFAVTSVLLFGCFLALIEVHRRLAVGYSWDAGLLVAVSPVVIADALINWDLLAVVLTSASLLLWARRRPELAGVLLGLAIAAKLYPLFLLGPLLFLCLRAGRMGAYGRLALTTGVTWLVVNLPVMIGTPSGWLYFWSFNNERGADLGSLWYVLRLGGVDLSTPLVGALSLGLFAAMCAAIAALCLLAPRRPRVAQVAFLVVAAFLLVNKVYSPQYALWLLPLLVLARPRLVTVLTWTLGELIYFGGIWGHLAGTLVAGGGGPDRLYWLSVLVRIGITVWTCVTVAADVLRVADDPLRNGDVPSGVHPLYRDDEIGGVLDGAPDVPWAARLAQAVGRPAPWPYAGPGHVVYGPVVTPDQAPDGAGPDGAGEAPSDGGPRTDIAAEASWEPEPGRASDEPAAPRPPAGADDPQAQA